MFSDIDDTKDSAYQIGFEDGTRKERKTWSKIIERQHIELNKRAAIIAEKILGWKQYHLDGNSEQMAYGPDEHTVKTLILLGDNLTKLVDNAIMSMPNPTE